MQIQVWHSNPARSLKWSSLTEDIFIRSGIKIFQKAISLSRCLGEMQDSITAVINLLPDVAANFRNCSWCPETDLCVLSARRSQKWSYSSTIPKGVTCLSPHLCSHIYPSWAPEPGALHGKSLWCPFLIKAARFCRPKVYFK